MLIAYKYSQTSKNNRQVKIQYNLKKGDVKGIPTKWDNLYLSEYTDGTFDILYFDNLPKIGDGYD